MPKQTRIPSSPPISRVQDRRRARGALSYAKGQAAEQQVAQYYSRRGARLLFHRWRGKAGEIDLVFEDSGEILCVEVKSSATHADAANLLKQMQIKRLLRATEEFIGTSPQGSLTPTRIDVALVDRQGRIEILENALLAL